MIQELSWSGITTYSLFSRIRVTEKPLLPKKRHWDWLIASEIPDQKLMH